MRLSSSSADTSATSSALRRLMITGSLDEATSSQRAARCARASVYVVTVAIRGTPNMYRNNVQLEARQVKRPSAGVQRTLTAAWVGGCAAAAVGVRCNDSLGGRADTDTNYLLDKQLLDE